MPLRYIFIACFLLCSGELLSQRYPFINYTPLDGLVNNRVRTMQQDSKGRLYFLTAGGLSVYDGARFTNYTTADGLAQELLNDMLEITPDSFLVATNINKLNCLVRGKILPIKTANGFCPIINGFFRAKDGTIYAAADDGVFEWQKDRFIPLRVVEKEEAEGHYFISIKEFGKYFLFLVNPSLSAEAGFIYVYDRIAGKTIYRYNDTRINYWDISPEGDLWIAGAMGIRVLKKHELEKGIFKPSSPSEPFTAIQNIPSVVIKFDKLGRIWLSSGEGVMFVKPGQPPVYYTEANGLASGTVLSIYHDREGNNWFLPDGGGAQKLVNSNIELWDRPYGSQYISDLSGTRLSDSVYLYGDSTAGLILIHGSSVKKFQVPPGHGHKKLAIHNGIHVYLFDETSLLKCEIPKTGTKLKVLCSYSYSINQICFGGLDPFGKPVVCGVSTIRVIFDDCSTFHYPIHYFADRLCFDKQKDLWIVTRSNKLIVLSLHPDNPGQYLQLKHDLSDQLVQTHPRSITIDDNNRIWIGTRFDGLYCYTLNGDRLQLQYHFTKKDGLTDNFINYLEHDGTVVWACSPAGLDKIAFINNKAVIENITEGSLIYVPLKKIVVDRQGTAWAMGESGNLVKVSKSRDGKETIAPTFFISRINAGKEAFISTDSIKSFNHTQNDISVFVSAPSFYDEKEVMYSYELKGAGNDQWSIPSAEAAFHFANLAAGNYTLNLKAEFPAGRFPPQFIQYSFAVLPPWWQTWWFRGLLILIAVGAIILGIRRYYRAKLLKQKMVMEKQQAVEKERTRIATDMHDDLGAGLSRIKFLSESIQFKKPGDESIMGEVQKIAAYSDEMVEKMGEIVWALNEKNDSLEHLVAFTRAYAAEYLTTNNIACVFKSADQLPVSFLTGEVRRNVFLSVKESLHNVVKHAGARTVTINVTIDPGLKFSIHDDGKGIDWNHIRPFSNGLSNIKKRMEEIGGKAEIQNAGGTQVILDVPLDT